MTPIQRQVLDFIGGMIAEKGFAPSIREIMTEMGWKSVESAVRVVDALVEQGHLVKTNAGRRNLALAAIDLSNVPIEQLYAEIGRRDAIARERISA